ncbi:phosphatidylcholine-sterol acyltransferase [Acrasis kona]|uniref:Lecithin-cholesterol acyltransferase n=1 Tax=Acrasis kona TaxID=1008807 RepID=A0AAW2ZC35_9EUKA
MHTAIALILFCTLALSKKNGMFIGLDNLPKQPFEYRMGSNEDNPNRAPVIFCGGLSGGALMFKKDNLQDTPTLCTKSSDDFYQGWINTGLLVPKITQPCLFHEIEPVFVNGSVQSKPGITVVPKDYGGHEGVTYIGTTALTGINIGGYAISLFNYLADKAGYKFGEDLRGANYDWRLGPKEYSRPNGDYHNFKNLIEETYNKNSNKRVHLIGHSLGGCYIQTFLTTYVSQEWKDKYVSSLISLAGSYLGAPMAAIEMATGTSFGIPMFDKDGVKRVMRKMGGAAWMLPTPNDEVMYITPKRNYTNSQLKEFFQDMKSPETFEIYQNEMEFGEKTKAPSVPVYCMYGVGSPTVTAAKMPEADAPTNIDVDEIIKQDGDETVPFYSLSACDAFANNQDQNKYPVVVDRFKGVTHRGIVSDAKILERVLNIVTSNK